MKTWFFTEDAYPYLPDSADYESIRVNLPNRHFDPVKGAEAYNMYLDLWLEADVASAKLAAGRVAGQAVQIMSGVLEV